MNGIIESLISGAAVVLSALVLRKVQQVHVLVDGRLDKVLRLLGAEQDRTALLTDTLEKADVQVPPVKS
jgi:hypothetical protein